jgi:hypothetical protein
MNKIKKSLTTVKNFVVFILQSCVALAIFFGISIMIIPVVAIIAGVLFGVKFES